MYHNVQYLIRLYNVRFRHVMDATFSSQSFVQDILLTIRFLTIFICLASMACGMWEQAFASRHRSERIRYSKVTSCSACQGIEFICSYHKYVGSLLEAVALEANAGQLTCNFMGQHRVI